MLAQGLNCGAELGDFFFELRPAPLFKRRSGLLLGQLALQALNFLVLEFASFQRCGAAGVYVVEFGLEAL
ncbi:MAG: hypothetical protein ACK44Y_17265 [Novosphingobium sp.]